MSHLLQMVLASMVSLVVALSASAAELNTIKSVENGVTIAVTPQLTPGTSISFKMVVDTHSQELNDDFLKSSVLFDSGGNRYAPLAWEGAGPGGHHREGVLKFPPLPSTTLIELQISRPKEQTSRTFRWQLQ